MLVTSLLSALFPRSNEIPLSIGFPARYLTIHVNQSCQFTTHIGAGSLIFDIGIGYCLCLLFVWIKKNPQPQSEISGNLPLNEIPL